MKDVGVATATADQVAAAGSVGRRKSHVRILAENFVEVVRHEFGSAAVAAAVTVASVLDLVEVERENSGHRTIATGQSGSSGRGRTANARRKLRLRNLLLLLLQLLKLRLLLMSLVALQPGEAR